MVAVDGNVMRCNAMAVLCRHSRWSGVDNSDDGDGGDDDGVVNGGKQCMCNFHSLLCNYLDANMR